MTASPLRFSPIFMLAAATALLPGPVVAAAFADPAAIDRQVAAFTSGGGAGAPGGEAPPIDRRLRLTPCAAPLALAWRGVRHDTVIVQCPDRGGWHLFVPLRYASGPGLGGAPAVAAVARGEEVTVAITGDGFTVSQSGEALESGVVGDWIRVSPIKDTKGASEPIRAQIVRPGLVAVLLP